MSWKELGFRMIVLGPLFLAAFYEIVSLYKFMKGVQSANTIVSFAAHAGGALTGLFFGTGILRNYSKQKWEGTLKNIFMMIFFTLLGGVIVCTYFDVFKK